MAWTETCKLDAREQIDKRKESCGSVRKAIREISKESDIPYGTLRRWYYPENVPKNGNTLSKPTVKKANESTSDLHSLQFDSGKKKIVFGLKTTDGNRFLMMQEYRLEKKDKEIPTKNRLVIPVDLFSDFRGAIDAVEAMLQNRVSGEPFGDGSDQEEDD